MSLVLKKPIKKQWIIIFWMLAHFVPFKLSLIKGEQIHKKMRNRKEIQEAETA